MDHILNTNDETFPRSDLSHEERRRHEDKEWKNGWYLDMMKTASGLCGVSIELSFLRTRLGLVDV